jgi:hypothetical protein
MAMKAPAFVAVGEGWEVVGGFEVKGFAEANLHGILTPGKSILSTRGAL